MTSSNEAAMSASGPKRTSLVAPHMSAFRGKADMTIWACLLLRSRLGVKRTWVGALHMSAFDPKRTWPVTAFIRCGPLVLHGSGRTLHDALDHHGGDAREHGLGLRGPQHVDDRIRPLRLLRRLGVATAEHIPELTGLPMQIGEHLAQFLRFGRHLSRQRYAARRGSLLQHLHERLPFFRRQLA